MPPRPPILAEHVEATVRAMAQVHADHYRQASSMQKIVAATTVFFARPAFIGILTIAVTAWIGLNLGLRAAGLAPPDPPPFPYLTGVASVAALYVAAMIMTTQRHDAELATRRDQLTLDLAILSEQKSAKIIRLLEELRRSNPDQSNNADPEAEAMGTPADPQAVLDAISSSHQQLLGDTNWP